MDNSHYYGGVINGVSYQIEIVLNEAAIYFHLKSDNPEKQFNKPFSINTVPEVIRKNFTNLQNFFDFFGQQEHFEVDPVKGQLTLHVLIFEINKSEIVKIPFPLGNQPTEKKPQGVQFPDISCFQEKKKKKFNISPQKQGDEEFDDYDDRMREFESAILLWRNQLKEESKMFAESIQYKFEERNGIWKGKYIGNQNNNKPNGTGIFVYDFGARLEAQWKNGERNGKCIYFTSQKNLFISEYKNGKLNGKQIKYFKDGRREEQELCDDFYHGRRRWYKPNGTLEREETWQYDYRVK